MQATTHTPADDAARAASGRARSSGRGLPDLAGIDGLRALAVVAVVVADAGSGWMTGGFVGIEMLLVLTGFVVTSSLLAEHHDHGRIDLLRFWGRRGRRALPGLLVMIGGVSLFILVARPDQLPHLGPQIRGVLALVSNWQLIAEAGGRAPETMTPSMLQHMWSWSVGAQFVVWWSLLVVLLLGRSDGSGRRGRTGRRRLRLLALALAVVSAVALVVLSLGAAPLRVIYGTDTRASGLLLGALVALALSPTAWWVQAGGAPARRLRTLGLTLLGALAVLALVLPRSDGVLRGGLLAVAGLTAVLLAVIVRSDELDGVLGVLPLRWLGLRSYGIFLWHWPVLVALGGPAAASRPQTYALYLVATIVLADMTYRFVEMPLCGLPLVRGSGRAGRSTLAVQATALACGVATVAALLTGSPAAAATDTGSTAQAHATP